jgi:hypothetical protein
MADIVGKKVLNMSMKILNLFIKTVFRNIERFLAVLILVKGTQNKF